MFYYKTNLVRRVRLHPQYISEKTDPTLTVKKLAMQEVRGQFSLEHGYYVLPTCVTKVGKGYCLPLIGFVEFAVTFEAICLYPVVGEVVPAEVVFVTDTCVFFRYACVYGVVRSFSLNDMDYFNYEEKEMESENQERIKIGLFRSKVDKDKVIEKGTVVRVRITRRTLGCNGFFLVGSMLSDFLGPMKNPPAPPMSVMPGQKIKNEEDPILKNMKVEVEGEDDPAVVYTKVDVNAEYVSTIRNMKVEVDVEEDPALKNMKVEVDVEEDPALKNMKVEVDPILQNLKVENNIIPHDELRKIWRQQPYNKPAPLSPPLAPINLNFDP
ncbi:DNA-directed RNA polymerase II subunit RPB7 [Orchesella cincta]|uniref:DNA-directed RNA polymerase II subunit RPB7 n=1 Tax=Orchesella cincta TaxID=48709 RepID=A0A1D2NCA2_ORCCI|nr:DNA-directed RNA polymerase II subunit RPB7 [Orchesella cincta]